MAKQYILQEFKRNLRGVNGGGNFDDELLTAIYHSIHQDEIVMPAEQTGLLKDNFQWKVRLQNFPCNTLKFS